MTTDIIWKNFSDHLYNFIFQKVKSEPNARDILQEVFFKVHKNIDRLRESDKLESWLFRITRNAITDHFRANGKEIKLKAQLPTLEPIEPQIGAFKDLEFLAANISQGMMAFNSKGEEDELADAIEFLKSICSFFEGVDPKYAEAVFWIDWKGISQKEFAEKAGISLSGAKSRVQRGREHVKSLFLQCCDFEFDKRGKIIDYQPKSDLCKGC